VKQGSACFEKRSKNFCHWCRARVMNETPWGEGRCKSFLVLFFKKEPLPLLALGQLHWSDFA
jgi:hypothetical protein